jgi:hypothetical protein
VARFRRAAISLPFVFLLAAGTALAAGPARMGDAWRALTDGRAKDALRALGSDRASRPARLARAAAVMSTQPAVDENMREAEGIFAELAEGDDEIAAEAAYLRARLHQLHYLQPDYARAAQLYLELAARRPESHWAQLGLVKLALLRLYVPADAAGAGGDRLAPAEALLPQIHEPLLQRDLHLQIGQAGVVLKQPLRRLLPHLVAAERLGGVSGTAREDLMIQIGELSLRAGLLGQSRDYFTRYLQEYPTGLRTFAVERRLEETMRQLALAKGGAR